LLLLAVLGCRGNPDREPLLRLLEGLQAAVGTPLDDEITKLEPSPERGLRFSAWMNRKELVVIDQFLAGNPPLTDKARDAVNNLRTLRVEMDEYYTARIAAQRFEPTNADRTKEQWYRAEVDERMRPLGLIADGKQ
jgi:hypothetical protein